MKKALSYLLILAILLTNLLPTMACSFLEETIFSYSMHPDFPLEKFVSGDLGIIRPSFARSYLVVAYRNLIGRPLSKTEQDSVLKMWGIRLGFSGAGQAKSGIQTWLDVRKKVLAGGGFDSWDAYRTVPSSYDAYLNCPDQAFINAANTLQMRINQFGATNPEVKDWVKAQDLVFCHCPNPGVNWKTDKPNPEPAFPQMLKSGSAIMLADRAYQIACAHFYAQDFDFVVNSFKKIASDQTSPWRTLAPYLMARALVRKATLSTPVDKDTLRQAEVEIKQILGNPSLKGLHDDALNLLDFVSFKLWPEKRTHELAVILSERDHARNLGDNLFDYTMLIDNLTDSDGSGDSADSSQISPMIKLSKLPSIVRFDQLTDWIFAFQDHGPQAYTHSLERWRATKSVPWLVACLTAVSEKDPDAATLLQAAMRISQQSPAFLTTRYHAIRLLAGMGKKDEARGELDKLLGQNLPPSSRNLLIDLRLPLCRNFAELAKYVAQRAVGISNEIEIPNDMSANSGQALRAPTYLVGKPYFRSSTVNLFNTLTPLALLLQLCQDKSIPQSLKSNIVQAVWTRAVLLNDQNAARALTSLLLTVSPKLAPYVGTWQKATTPEQKIYAQVYMMLKCPGLGPFVRAGRGRVTAVNQLDDYQDNWWCLYDPRADDTDQDAIQIKAQTTELTAVLTESQKKIGALEYAELSKLCPGSHYLLGQVIAWAGKNPSDPRLPEALHLAIKSPRYGCRGPGSSQLSKKAFQILHQKYPNSPWTRKTKYWY